MAYCARILYGEVSPYWADMAGHTVLCICAPTNTRVVVTNWQLLKSAMKILAYTSSMFMNHSYAGSTSSERLNNVDLRRNLLSSSRCRKTTRFSLHALWSFCIRVVIRNHYSVKNNSTQSGVLLRRNDRIYISVRYT